MTSSAPLLQRKTFPIKRNDSEMLTRQDIQFDLLYYIFADPAKVFTDQTPGKLAAKVNFCDLYVNALYHSRKCSKVLKDKMKETPAFAIEFGKISLLANVGRINTTMACKLFESLKLINSADHEPAVFPEMKTALRTYHPVPSLQRTDGNLQDAPRIKNCLKAALLPSETRDLPPAALTDVMQKRVCGSSTPLFSPLISGH